MSLAAVRTFVVTVLPFAIVLPAPARADGDTYNNSVHIDKNTGSVTVNGGTTMTFNVQNGMTEAVFLRLLQNAQLKAGANWKTAFTTSLDAINHVSARQLKAITEGFATVEDEIASLTASVDQGTAQSSEIGHALASMRADQARAIDYLAAGQAQIALLFAKRSQNVASEFDKRFGFGLRFDMQSVLLPHQTALGLLNFALGPVLTYDLAFFDDYHRGGLRLNFGAFGGWGHALGGYEDPGGAILTFVDFQTTRFYAEVGLSVRTGLGMLTNVEANLGVRGGIINYTSNDGLTELTYGSMQVPVDVVFSYKPWSWLAVGTSVGSGIELFASTPLLRYTGIAANTAATNTTVRALAEFGIHAAYCW
jgi:hypothetical protein